MTNLAQTIANLSPEKRRLLEQKLRERGVDMQRAVILPQPRDTDTFPASYAQQRLWFLHELEPESSAYNVPTAVRLYGTLELPTLERALNALVQRHETLRTAFIGVDGQPHQVIRPALTLQLQMVDLRAQPAERRDAEARRLLAEEAGRTFDLRQAPLLRVTVLRLADDDQIIAVVMHHIIADGWSSGIFIGELTQLYLALSHGRSDPLPPLPLQYADYAVWQRTWLEGQELTKQLEYWLQQLGPEPPVLQLPTDRPRPTLQREVGAHHPLALPLSLTTRLIELGHTYGTTLFMTLLAGFGALLARYSGQERFCIGTPVANRRRAELEGLIGCFINTLALPMDLGGRPSFRTLLERVREMTLGAFANQDTPFELLVEQLQPERNLGHTPLFQAMLVLQNAPVKETELPGLRLQPVEVDHSISTFDLTLVLEETKAGLVGMLEYNTDLFNPATIRQLAAHLIRLLESAVAAPDQPVTTLPLLTPAEREQLVNGWNATAYPHPTDRCIHQLIAAQAARQPDALALIGREVQLTYAELEARANRLAGVLQRHGVGPETIVGVCLGRSPELIIALLAILKAGGAYLPLDPALPSARLGSILADARPTVIVSASAPLALVATAYDLAAPLAPHLIDLATIDLARPEPTPGLTEAVTADHLAYVIYTSGSTGMPKGVLVPHRAVVNHNQAVVRAFGLGPGDHVLQFSTISFDAAVEEIFPTLQCGATLVLRPDDMPLSPAELLTLAAAHKITVLDLPTAYWHSLVAEMARTGATPPPSLRLVVVGGEAASPEVLVAWRRTAPAVTWVNTYGPTEATVIATWYPLGPDDLTADPSERVPLGRPIDNVRVYVLDHEGQPAPVGVVGELYLGGAGVARGYLNRPELTAEHFVPDPFSDNGQARLYRTGDLARWRADGVLEFLGRTDQQVKIRGYRVEPGEVAATIEQHTAIREALVLVHERAEGEQQLVAYYVPGEPPGPAATELRAFVQARLPAYMVPVACIEIPAIPLTLSGKVDRKALPQPDALPGDPGSDYVAPRNPMEEVLAGLYADLLGVRRVGVHDDFFALGGHSLLATRLTARVRELFHSELPLRTFFEAPTVAQLAERIAAGGTGAALPPIAPAPRDGELPLSSGQQRLWFLDQLEPGSPLYNIPSALRLSGKLDVEALERSLGAIVRRHEVLRTTFASVDGQAVQVISPAGPVELPVVDLQSLAPEQRPAEAERLAAAEAQAPFDLARGPLFRARLLRLADDEHLALLIMHHSIADGWSMGVLIEELGKLYTAFVSGSEPDLPALPVQYADYAAWQRAWLQSEQIQAPIAYWRDQLADSPATLDLPTDRPRPAVQSARGAHLPIALPRALSDQLQELARQEGATMFMALLAAFNVLLHRYSEQTDICVGTPAAGRVSAELEPLIGFFVNTLVLRTYLGGAPSFRELLRRVRNTTIDAYSHQSVPFELVVDAVQPERNLGQTPLFQVMFMLQNTPRRTLELPALMLSPVEPELGISNFDLTLALEECDDGLRGGWEYSTDLFDTATIARMASHFEHLLAALVADPDRSIATAPLFSAEERRRLLSDWNATERAHAFDRCIHTLIEEQVARTPAALALLAPGTPATRLSYAELNAQANRLAHHLQQHGVGPEVLVGLYLDRSPDLLISLLAVLKAGGAYLPLDPASPANRLQLILADARPRAVLTAARYVTDLSATIAAVSELDTVVLDLDEARAELERRPDANPASEAKPDNLAYVIYTSGSTGTPKGVLVEHRSVVNHNQAVRALFALSPHDRVLQFNALAFDAAVEEIFPTWQAGAALVLRPAGPAPGGAELLELVAAHGVTVLDLPTAYWHALTAEVARPEVLLPPSLRLVAVGGEAASPAQLTAWQGWAESQVTWINTYGPTEATVICTALQLPAGAVWDGTAIPIGKPIDNLRAYVLDPAGEPAPIGVFGELFVGGAGVARGYLNRPELTAERFVPDPFSGRPGARLYRTGDRVRWRPDGTLEFLGRVDNQVKIRGFRVEPDEVAAVLAQHPGVREAAVLARAYAETLRLVAYVVPIAPEGAEQIAEADLFRDLREYLRTRLPEYMFPADYVALPSLPLTTTGKLDRRALPDPVPAAGENADDGAGPRSDVERTLAAIWAQALGLPRVGVHDNFFALGGDSILSIQVIARANQAGLRLTPRHLFEAPTIAGLAALVGSGPAILAEQGAVVGEAPLTPIQHWFITQGFPERHHWNQALMLGTTLRLQRPLLEATLDRLQAHHDALRCRLRETGSGTTLVYVDEPETPPGREVLRWFDLSAQDEAAQNAAITRLAAETQASLDLDHGPIWRVAAFDLGAGCGMRLLVVAHHLVVDGVAWRILLEDLQTIYTQLSAGQPAQLPPKTTSFRQWALRLSDYAQSAELRADLAYWSAPRRRRAAPLPLDFPGGSNLEASACSVSRSLDPEATRALLSEVPATYNTEINDALLAALARALMRWSGSPVCAVNLEGHGREPLFDDLDVSRTIGWFTTLFPVYLDLSEARDPGAALRTVKEQLRAVPRRGVGYGLLRYLSGDPACAALLQGQPEPMISFNYLGQIDQAMPEELSFTLAGEEPGPQRSPRARREQAIDLTVSVAGGQLQTAWTYSEKLHRSTTIAQLAEHYLATLRDMIAHCRAPDAAGYTPSDFALANLDQRKLDKVMARLGKSKERAAR